MEMKTAMIVFAIVWPIFLLALAIVSGVRWRKTKEDQKDAKEERNTLFKNQKEMSLALKSVLRSQTIMRETEMSMEQSIKSMSEAVKKSDAQAERLELAKLVSLTGKLKMENERLNAKVKRILEEREFQNSLRLEK